MSHYDIVLTFAEQEAARKGRLLERMRILKGEAENCRNDYYACWQADHRTDLSKILSCIALFERDSEDMSNDDREALIGAIEEKLTLARETAQNVADDGDLQERRILSAGAENTPDFAAARNEDTQAELQRRWEALCGDYYMLSGKEYSAELTVDETGANTAQKLETTEKQARPGIRLTEESVRKAEKDIGNLRKREFKRRFAAALTDAGLPVYGDETPEADTLRMDPGVEELVVRGTFPEEAYPGENHPVQKARLQLMRTGKPGEHSREELQQAVGSFCSRAFAERMAAALEKQGLKVERICAGEDRKMVSQRGQAAAKKSSAKDTSISSSTR